MTAGGFPSGIFGASFLSDVFESRFHKEHIQNLPQGGHVNLFRFVIQRLTKGTQDKIDPHRRLENHENMRIIMRIDCLTSVTQVQGAIATPEPFSPNRNHAAITQGIGMHE